METRKVLANNRVLLFFLFFSWCCSGHKPTVESLHLFATSVEGSLNRGEMGYLIGRFDISSLENKSLLIVNSSIEHAELKANKSRYYELKTVLNGLFSQFASKLNYGGCFRFCKVYFEKEAPHFVFSHLTDLGINFIDFEISEDGSKILDFYSYQIGEAFSETFAEHIINQLGRSRIEYLELLEKINNAQYYFDKAQYDSASLLLTGIPLKLLNKNNHALRVEIAKRKSFGDYSRAFSDFIKSDSLDTRFVTYQMMIHHIYISNFKEAVDNLNLLRKNLGDSSLLEYTEGYCYLKSGQEDLAIKLFDRIIQICPKMYKPYFYKLYSLLLLKKVDEGSEFSEQIKNIFPSRRTQVDSILSSFKSKSHSTG